MKRSLTLGQRIALGASVLIFFVLFASGLGLWYAYASAQTLFVTERSVVYANRLIQLDNAWNDVTVSIDRLLLTRQSGVIDGQLEEQLASFNEQLAALEAMPLGMATAFTPWNERIINDLRLFGTDITAVTEELVLAGHQRRWAQATVLRHTELASLQRRFDESLEELRGNATSETDNLVSALLERQRRIGNYLTMGVLLAVVGGTVLTVLGVRTITRPVYQLIKHVQGITEGKVTYLQPLDRSDELGTLSRSFSLMTEWLQESYQTLEERVAERTRNLSLAAQLGQSLGQVRDLDSLLSEAVETIRERFDLYYTQVYLASGDSQTLVLRAGTGDAGKELLERGLQLHVDRKSINGTAARERPPVVIPDADESPIFRPNALLPDTRSEIAVPLVLGNRVVGVLDMQSDHRYGFTEDSLAAFEVLAGQLAIAIENARLFDEARSARAELDEQAQLRLSERWQAFLDAIHRSEHIGYTFLRGNLLPAESPVLEDAVGEDALTTPITMNNERIGVIHLQADESTYWTAEQIDMVNTVAHQVAQQVENLRLLAEAERYQLEAEAAVRRLTREGWETFHESGVAEQNGYLYDGKEIAPLVGTNGEHAITYPLTVRGEPIGELLVDEEGNQIDDEAALLVAEVSARLSAHLENLRLARQTEMALSDVQRRSEELTLLNRVVTQIAGTLDLRRSLQYVVDELVQATAADQARIDLLSEDRTTLTVVAEHHNEELSSSALGQVIPVEGNQLTQEVLETKRSIVISNTSQHPRLTSVQNRLRKQGITAMVIMPILAGNEVIGTVRADILDDKRMFDEEGVRLAETIVFQAATAIQNARLFDQVQNALAETRVLYQAGAELNKANTYDEVLEVLRRHTVAGDGSAVVSLTLFNTPWMEGERPSRFDLLAYWSAEPKEEVTLRYELDQFEAVEELIRRDRHTFIYDINTDPRLDEHSQTLFLHGFTARTILAMPLLVGGQWIGHVNMSYPQPRRFTDAELQRLQSLISQAAVAVQSINLLDETNRLLESEQRQRRISDILVRATGSMMYVGDEHDIRRVVVDEVDDVIRPDQIALYEWHRDRDVLRLNIRKVGSHARPVDGYEVGQIIDRGQRQDLWNVINEGKPFLEHTLRTDEMLREHYLVPWFVGNELGGLIEAYHTARGVAGLAIREEDQAAIEGIVQQAAVRLQNARLFVEAELRAEELAILNEMGQSLTSLLDVQSVLENVYHFTSRLMDTNSFYIALPNLERNVITFPLFVENGARVDWPDRVLRNGMTEYVIRNREPLLIQENFEAKLEELGLESRIRSVQSWLGVPMVFNEEVIGVIALQSATEAGLYDRHEQELLSAIASTAAIAIQNAHLFEETQQRAAETEALYQASRRINTAENYDDIVAAVRANTILGQGAKDVSFNYFERPWVGEEMPELVSVLARWTELPAERLRSQYPLVALGGVTSILSPGQPTVVIDVASDARLDDHSRAFYQEQFGAVSLIFVPLLVGGQWIGFIQAIYQDVIEFPEVELRQLMALAGQAATAAQGLYLLEQAQSRARRERILREITERVRSATDVDVIMKTAVREVSRALARDAFVYLGDEDAVIEHSGKAAVKEKG